MLTREMKTLPLNTAVRLYVQVNPQSDPTWRRVGTVTRIGTGVSTVFDAGARQAAPLWDVCTSARVTGDHVVCAVRFGVFEGRRGMTVIARGSVTRAHMAVMRRLAPAHRRSQRRLRGAGPRGVRSAWPQM